MTDVRERLAEVLAFPTSFDAATFDAWRYGMADAILSDSELVDALVRSRLEQVGWWYRQASEPSGLQWSSNVAHAPWWPGVSDITPAYRIVAAPDPEGAQDVPPCGWCRRPASDRLTCTNDPCGLDERPGAQP